MRQLYSLHDDKDRKRWRATVSSLEEAHKLNLQGYGIFWSVNDFAGDLPKKDNLVNIRSWYVDMDDFKEPLAKLLERFLVPSLVCETNRGMHIYYNAKDATKGNYERINKRLLKAFGGSTSVYDYCRILRAPGFYHMKDPTKPFLVKAIFECDVAYTEAQMLALLKPHPDEAKQSTKRKVVATSQTGETYFDKIHNYPDQRALLEQLSGSRAVSGERFTFRRAGSGETICVDDKPTNTWVDRQGRIGSVDGGGPSVWEYVGWYGHSHREVEQLLKEIIGEL